LCVRALLLLLRKAFTEASVLAHELNQRLEHVQVLKGGNFDIIYDTVGGAGVWDHAAHVLKKDGVFVTIAAESKEVVRLSLSLSSSYFLNGALIVAFS
jgi:NADPH:quinone reductase-like Zn-dependent oxidoreductase